VRQGSSIGLQFVTATSQWANALAAALRFDSEVLFEEQIAGRETTVGILAGAALPLVEVRPKRGGYDYQNKYTPGATEYFCPADFDAATTRRIQAAALGAFQAVGGRDYARVDVMVRPNGEPVVLEVNTLPGMTETSLLPKAAAALGLDYAALCQRMVELAWLRKTTPPKTPAAARPGKEPHVV
jgi:D-alanine-D-alanine ligase